RVPRCAPRSVLRGHGARRQLLEQGPAARDVHDRGMAREVRHEDGERDDRGDRKQDGPLHFRRALARGETRMRWWLPDPGSTFAGPIDTLFLAILIITGIALVIVEVGLITFVIRYRARPGRKAFYTH